MKQTVCLGAAMILCAYSALGENSNILAPGAALEKLSGEFAFTEGPASDREGNVYFTDQPNDRIMLWEVKGRLSTFMQPSGRANGLSFDQDGQLWACADGKNELWRIDPESKEVKVVLTGYQQKLFNGPNDIWITSPRKTLRSPADSGDALTRPGLYFTDPFYKRNYWNRGPKEMPESVYYLPPGSQTPVRVIDDLKQPNGIIGTPDGKHLYVADIGAGRTYRYQIDADGSLAQKTVFCERGSDGLTIDNEGNIYTTSKGVFVYSPAGEQILHIEVPEAWTANVCFGGADHRTLFITASKGLYSMKMRVRGVGSQ